MKIERGNPMTTQALNLPLDITWQRFGYSTDMIDTNFGELNLPPKWRSSMAVYSYVVPQEQTAESYPNARIVYLRLTCSITGWNPSEELRNAVNLDNVGDQLDDVQKSIWEAIQADGWASTYWACLGAIAQIAVYPSAGDGQVNPDNFPYISGITKSKDVTTVNNQTTDTSRERRETTSFSTNFSQMYQLFNGYHLGTNRALFVIAPRPHTKTNDDPLFGFNLLDGERKLEGIQDMFLVVYVPASLKGICLQVNLDTGHDVDPNISDPVRAYMRYTDRPPRQPNGEDEPGPRPGGGGNSGGAAPALARTLKPDDDGRQARIELVN